MRRARKFVTLAMNEPFGVMGIVCPDEAPLLALVSLVAPAIAMGNAVVVVPSADHPLAATDFYQRARHLDLPGGVVNIVTGEADALTQTLAEHDGVDALWRAGGGEGDKAAEEASAGNLKSTWMRRRRRRLGGGREGANSCAAPVRSRRSGRLTASDVGEAPWERGRPVGSLRTGSLRQCRHDVDRGERARRQRS